MAGFGKPQKHKKSIKQGASRPKTEEAIQQSIIKYQQGDLEGAKIELEETLQEDHTNSFALGFLATIEKALGNKERALKLFKRSTEINQDNPDILHNYSGLLIECDPKKAITLSNKAVHISPENSRYLERNGYLKWQAGDLENALEATLKALRLSPILHGAHINLGGIYKDLGELDRALASTLKSLELKPDNPDALINLGSIYKDLGKLDQALASILKSLELKSDNPDALCSLGDIYKDLGELDQALVSTLKSLELKPDNPDALINLGSIYKYLGKLDKALASTLKSLELKPEDSQALCNIGIIKMTLGQTREAKRYLLTSLKYNNQQCDSYYALSTIIETAKEAEEVIELMTPVKASSLTSHARAFAEFARSNCFHKSKKYDAASKCLQLANNYKLIVYPSNADSLLQEIALRISYPETAKKTNNDLSIGERRIFIVGMPRSGSTLLETILSINPEIQDLGESQSLSKAIKEIELQNKGNFSYEDINTLYSQMQPIDNKKYKYTTDKQLYNFIYVNWITTYMPAAKIIHCRRNPMDNILSMYRSCLTAGNNYTSNLEDSARVLIAQEQAMQIQKTRYHEKIFTFNYDQFVNTPEDNLRELLIWLDLEFNDNYLHPEKSRRRVNTASVMQARKPISNKSVGGWRNYETLLKPALKIIQESGVIID